MLADPGVDDLDAHLVEVETGLGGVLADQVLAAQQDGRAQLGLFEAPCGADDGGLLALGEHHPLVGGGAHGAGDVLHQGGGRIEARAQLGPVSVHVLDRLARHAGIHRRLGDEGRDVPDQARVEGTGDDVVGAELQAAAVVGGGDLVRHVFPGQHGQGVGAGDLHLHVHPPGAHIEGAAEDVGEAQDVVDLVDVVGPAGGHDGVRTDRGHVLGRDLRIRIGHGEDDRIGGHGGHHFLGDRALGRQAEDHIGADHGLGEGAVRRVGGVGRLPLVHPAGPALVDHAFAVDDDGVLGADADGLHQADRGKTRSAGAGEHNLDVLQLLAGDVAGVDQAGGRDDGRAVLVVMEDGDVEQVLQLALDDETFRGLDVLQIDAAPGVADVLDDGDELVRIGGLDLDVEAVDVGEPFEQDGLALHHRLGRHVAEVAEAEDGRAVGDDGDQIALGRIVVGLVRIGGDRQHRDGHARRIGQRQVALGRHGLGRRHGNLARRRTAVKLQRVFVGEGLFVGEIGHACS